MRPLPLSLSPLPECLNIVIEELWIGYARRSEEGRLGWYILYLSGIILFFFISFITQCHKEKKMHAKRKASNMFCVLFFFFWTMMEMKERRSRLCTALDFEAL
jgi:hypothetical protein